MLKQVSGTKTVYGIVISSDTIQRHNSKTCSNFGDLKTFHKSKWQKRILDNAKQSTTTC